MRAADRGQLMVEMALLLPLLLVLFAGSLIFGLAMIERVALTWDAQEAAYAAATAGAEDSACDAARGMLEAATGRVVAFCDGSEGLTMSYDPGDTPGTVSITIAGSTWSPPLLDPVTITGRATAVIRETLP